MSVGIKVSTEGNNVTRLEVADSGNKYYPPNRFIFSSDWALFKTILTGTFSMSIDSTIGTSSTTTHAIAHNLGYAPAVMIFFTEDGVNWYSNNTDLQNSLTTSNNQYIQCFTDSTNINITAYSNNVAAYDIDVRWLVYGEPSE